MCVTSADTLAKMSHMATPSFKGTRQVHVHLVPGQRQLQKYLVNSTSENHNVRIVFNYLQIPCN